MNNPIFVTGIGTGVGKTIASAVITEALNADYWKPVQCGDLDNTDRMKVKELISNPKSIFHPERYQLKNPVSPHYAAKLEGINIQLTDFEIPGTTNQLIIEGAGGLMVPLNDHELMVDLIQYLNAGIVLVIHHYLGSINHSLLSIEVVKLRGIKILGVIFNGVKNDSSEEVILKYSGLNCIGRIPELLTLDKQSIKTIADNFKSAF